MQTTQQKQEVKRFMSELYQVCREIEQDQRLGYAAPEVVEIEDCPVGYEAYNWEDR